ncbi:hypothetical protein ON010_g4997 [Phytophthora cinnamomi]|nr:hypothetical protein ON010_g4997 [Phytophthora cinnamomi]
MPKGRFTSTPFPELRVSDIQRLELIHLVENYVEDYVNKYEEFVLVNQRNVDEHRWEHVKSKDKLHVYSERTRKELSRRGMQPETSLSATQRVQAKAVTKELPVVMSVGTFVGELDDLMFGVVNPTLDDMRIKASYVHDLESAAVVCSVQEPSKDDPFRSLVIKWMTIDVPLPSSLIKSRDFVYVEATGVLHFANGEQVGYHLKHSIEFPETKPRPNVIRAKMSYCGFYRQVNSNVIDVFGTSTTVPGGDIRRFIANRVATDSLLSTNNLVFCGQMKKMSWMLQQQRSVGLQRERSKNCVVCNKNTSSGIRGRFGKSTCKLCYGSVCFSCKIHWRISFIAPGEKLIQRKIAFCATCITRASFCSAKKAARDQATGFRAYKALSTASQSDTAEMSGFSADSHADVADMLDWECL